MNLLAMLGKLLINGFWIAVSLSFFCVFAFALLYLLHKFEDAQDLRKLRKMNAGPRSCRQCGEVSVSKEGYCPCCKWVNDNLLGLAQRWNEVIYEVHLLRQTMRGDQ